MVEKPGADKPPSLLPHQSANPAQLWRTRLVYHGRMVRYLEVNEGAFQFPLADVRNVPAAKGTSTVPRMGNKLAVRLEAPA